MHFIPVEAEKSFKVEDRKKEDRFAGKAIITLSKVEEGKSKMLELSQKAIEVLGLTEEESHLGIARGYVNASKDKEALFVYRTDAESVSFVSDKKTSVKIDTPKINLNTRRAMSAKYHGIISGEHEVAESAEEKHFMLSTEYGSKYWMLTPYNGVEAPVIVATEDEVEENQPEVTLG